MLQSLNISKNCNVCSFCDFIVLLQFFLDFTSIVQLSVMHVCIGTNFCVVVYFSFFVSHMQGGPQK